MTTKYPKDADAFRPYLDGFDEMLASDLDDMYEAILAVQTELGLKPSGEFGTIAGRLFANGNLSERLAYWQREEWNRLSVDARRFVRGEAFGNVEYSWRGDIMKGQETVFGEDTPGAFMGYEFPLTDVVDLPWRHAISRINDQRAQFVGLDMQGDDMQTQKTATVGFLFWNLFTGGELAQ